MRYHDSVFLTRDRFSRFLLFLTFQLVQWSNVFMARDRLSRFCSFPHPRQYHGSMCLARDRLSTFLQFLTSQLEPLFSVFGPKSIVHNFCSISPPSQYCASLSLARDRRSRCLPFLTSQLVGPCPGPGVLLANLKYAWARCRDGDKLDALVSTMVQGAWPDIGFQDFCSFSPSSQYHGPMCLARDRLSRFLQFLTF